MESPGHLRSHTLPLAQPTLHDPVHTTWQVADVQPMLLLDPTVKSQVAPEAQLKLVLLPAVSEQVLPPLQMPLHELPQVPLQVPVVQETEQLATPGSHPIGVAEVPPHAAIAANPIATKIIFIVPPFLCRLHMIHTRRSTAGTAATARRAPTRRGFANR